MATPAPSFEGGNTGRTPTAVGFSGENARYRTEITCIVCGDRIDGEFGDGKGFHIKHECPNGGIRQLSDEERRREP